MSKELNGYDLSRKWFEISFESETKPIHTALFFWIVEVSNRIGWQKEFGLPTDMAMLAIGVKNYRTYKKALVEMEELGVIKVVKWSQNQYTSTRIALVIYTKATTGAGTRASTNAIAEAHAQADTTAVLPYKTTNHKPQTTNNKQKEISENENEEYCGENEDPELLNLKLVKKFWLELNPGYVWENGQDTKASRLILKKVKQSVQQKSKGHATAEDIRKGFEYFLSNLTDFYLDQELKTIAKHFNSAVSKKAKVAKIDNRPPSIKSQHTWGFKYN